jgi:acyl-homoserine lactone acylase PvdQ
MTIPGTRQTAAIAGLSGPVDITYDTDWVPRVKAGSEADAAAAMGFLHARDRMFQMELMPRAASDRLSEIAGTATLPIDRMMRTLGLRQHAVADFATLSADTQAMLEAYARSVNAALQSVHGASFRGVYDLAELYRSLLMITPGQSGNPFSGHARDLVLRWRDGATITLGPAAASITGTVRLIP